jgi:hypothetical protein
MIQRFTTSLKIGNLVKKLKLTERTRTLTGKHSYTRVTAWLSDNPTFFPSNAETN